MQCTLPGLTRNQRRKLNRKMRNDQINNSRQAQSKTLSLPSRSTVVNISSNGAGGGSKRNARKNRRRGRGRGGSSNGPNWYLRSLQDPESNPDAKIPDMVSFPSGTFQMVYDANLTVASGGDGVAAYCSPTIGGDTAGSWQPIHSGVNITKGGAAQMTGHNWSKKLAVQALYQFYRPVSGVMYAEYTGTSQLDSGEICGALVPKSGENVNQSANFELFIGCINNYISKTIPVRNGIVVLWKPQDNADLEYRSIVDGSGGGSVSGRYWLPAIGFCTAGMQPNASVRVRFVFNYEGIPSSDVASMVNSNPSPINLNFLQEALTWTGQTLNNISAFVTNVSPYVQPTLNAAMRIGAPYLANRFKTGFGDSMRIQY